MRITTNTQKQTEMYTKNEKKTRRKLNLEDSLRFGRVEGSLFFAVPFFLFSLAQFSEFRNIPATHKTVFIFDNWRNGTTQRRGHKRARACTCVWGGTDRQMMVLAYIRWRFGRAPWITLYIKLRFIPLWTWTSFGRQMYICFNFFFFFLWLSVCVAGEPFALIYELGPSAWNHRRITPVE